jgi:hypothetical protein
MAGSERGTQVEEVKAARKGWGRPIARFFLWFSGGVVLLAVLVAARDVVHWHNFRREYLQDPGLKVFPKPVPDISLATAKGTTTVTQSGCSIDLPRPDLKTRIRPHGLSLFPDGGSILFEDPAQQTDEAGNYRGAHGPPSAVPIFGAATLRSNYDFLAAQLNFDPADLTLLPWGRRAERSRFLGIGKYMLTVVRYKQVPIYSVTIGNVRGFQFGDPSQAGGRVELRMFDAKDREFQVDIWSGQQPWTQPEINFMIYSMRCDDAVYDTARKAWEEELRPHR